MKVAPKTRNKIWRAIFSKQKKGENKTIQPSTKIMRDNDDSMPVELNLEFGINYGDSSGGEGCQHRVCLGVEAPQNHSDDNDSGHVYVSGSYYCGNLIGTAVQDDQDDDGSDNNDDISDDDVRGRERGNEGFATSQSSSSSSSSSSSKMHNEMPRKLFQPSSLLHLATKLVASNLEIINPGAIGLLSEYHWGAVVQERARKHGLAATNMPNSGKALPLIAMDGNSSRRLLPALSEKILTHIEQHPNNAHLAKSTLADDLLWQDIVDYTFSGMTRPPSLEDPCSIVKERLKTYGKDLLEIMICPMTEDEFAESSSQSVCLKLRDHAGYEEQGEISQSMRLGGITASLFDMDTETCPNKAAATAGDTPLSAKGELYQQYLEVESQRQTNNLQFILIRLTQTPMDVVLLGETDIGKSLNKCIKIMKKLLKSNKPKEMENENFLCGYPRFWKPCRWDAMQEQHLWSHVCKCDTLKTPLEVMQQILQDWKGMASVQTPPASTQNIGITQPSTIATCGRGKHISLSQHHIDMKLLHSSPDWRSLYQSLKNRQGIVKKIQGDRVRSIRENLEKARPKIGKVVLKKAVGRVRGRDDKYIGRHSSAQSMAPPEIVNAGGPISVKRPISAQATQLDRREAILSKSLGHRHRQHQLAAGNRSPLSGNGKLSQIRSESKIAASWSKSSIEHTNPSPSSFGMAVSRACGSSINDNSGDSAKKRQRPGSQVRVDLGHGKSMKLPPFYLAGAGKAAGTYSSLQKKMRK